MDNLNKNGVSAIVEYDYTAKEPDELDLIKGATINNIKKQSGGWWEGTLASSGKIGMFPDNFVRVIDHNDESTVVLRDKSAITHRKCKVIYSYTQVNEDELSLAVGEIIEFLGEVEEGWWRGRLKDKVGVFPSNFVSALENSPILASKRPNMPISTTLATPTMPSPAVTTAAITPQISSNNLKSNRSSLYSSKEDLLSNSISPTISASISTVNLEKDAPLLPPKPLREYCRVEFPYKPQNEDELELNAGDVITVINKELPDKGWWRGEIRGKVGVFPDNFVKLLPPDVSPSTSHPDRPHSSAGGSSKVFIKKSGSTSSTQSSNRKDSFGSRDSLNDILSETGLQTGNVAAQRKSLENKKLDLANNGGAIDGVRSTRRSVDNKSSEIRKSVESMDEKKAPPPVITKKPTVPAKKTSSVTSVAGNIISGLKSKVKSVEQRLSSSTLDTADGVGGSKINSQVADSIEKGVVIERVKRGKDDSEFDNVERGTILPDMRAGRVKAPKRRPPSAAINVIGESNNNNSIYINGTESYLDDNEQQQQNSSTGSLDNEELAKPKPREWEKKKAPWMAELKASQEKKKTSPIVEPRVTASERLTKIEPDTKIVLSENSTISTASSSSSSSSAAVTISSSTLTNNINYPVRRSIETTQSFDAKSPQMQQQSFNTEVKKETNSNINMSKSMSAIGAPKLVPTNDLSTIIDEDVKIRPNSLSIRNRSISPLGRILNVKSTSIEPKTNSAMEDTAAAPSSASNCLSTSVKLESTDGSDLEQRVHKLETIVQSQQLIIEELVRTLREETDKVKGIKTELDKYAQCVTQV